MRTLLFATFCLSLLFASGCREEATPQDAQSREVAAETPAAANQEVTVDKNQSQTEALTADQELPRPPITEDFEGAPKLSLFPRIGDFRPADDSDRLPYWETFIDHLVRITGVAEEQATGSRAWTFRSIDSIDSVGYFSPLAVEPGATYQVSFTLAAELAEGASAGLGILEFNEFLWVPGQYTEEQFKQHYLGSQEGQRLTGTIKGKHTFTFTTGPETHMIHLVLFREGPHDRNSVRFDDIQIVEVKKEN